MAILAEAEGKSWEEAGPANVAITATTTTSHRVPPAQDTLVMAALLWSVLKENLECTRTPVA